MTTHILTPRPPLFQYGGVVAPDGRYFPCPYGGHGPLAHALFKKFGQLDDWITIPSDGDIYHDGPVTAAQIETLTKLAEAPRPDEPPKFILNWPRFEYVDVYRMAGSDWKNNILGSIHLWTNKNSLA